MITCTKLTNAQDAATYYTTPEAGASLKSKALGNYYAEKGHALGEWHGSGAAALGLVGEVTPAQLEAVLSGLNPTTGEDLKYQLPTSAKEGGSALDKRLAEARESGRKVEEKGADAPGGVVGYDLTASVSKGTSLLGLLGTDVQKAAVALAREAAQEAALKYLTQEACRTRSGKAGRDQIVGGGFIVAAYDHETARPDGDALPDPQLHTHMVVANLTQRPDGSWRALDGKEMMHHTRIAGAIYAAEVRKVMSRELGVSWTPLNDKGISEIEGVPREVIDTFSKRRLTALEEVRKNGGDLTNLAHLQAAILATRDMKLKGVTTEDLMTGWHSQLMSLGYSMEDVTKGIEQAAGRRPEVHTDAQILEELTAMSGHFQRPTVVRLMVERGEDPETVQARVDAFLAREGLAVRLLQDRHGVVSKQGVTTRTEHQGRWTSPQVIAAEQTVLEMAHEGAEGGYAKVEVEAVEAVMNRPAWSTIGDDQRAAVDHLMTRGDRVAVLVGPAGTGKTHTMRAVKEVAEAQGLPVIGVSTSGAAALNLQNDTGVASSTIASLLASCEVCNAGMSPLEAPGRERLQKEWDEWRAADEARKTRYAQWQTLQEEERLGSKGQEPGWRSKRAYEQERWNVRLNAAQAEFASLRARGQEQVAAGLEPNTILIVDEAGMAGSKDLARLAEIVAETPGAKLILAGDDKQLQAVAAGGLFKDLRERYPETVVSLEENRRQVREDEAATLTRLQAGGAGEQTVGEWVERGQVVIGENDPTTKLRMVEDYFAVRDSTVERRGETKQATALMMAYRRDDVRDLNILAVAQAEARGDLVGDAVAYDPDSEDDAKAFRCGHRVELRKNGKDMSLEPGVKNKEVKNRRLGTVTEVTPAGVKVQLDDGPDVLLGAEYAKRHLELGYASTTHGAQGKTVDAGLILGTGLSTSHNLYVGMSRGRGSLDEQHVVNNRLYLPLSGNPRDSRETQEAEVMASLLSAATNEQGELSAHTAQHEGLVGELHRNLDEVTRERDELRKILRGAPEDASRLRIAAERELKQAKAEYEKTKEQLARPGASDYVRKQAEKAFTKLEAASSASRALGSTAVEHPQDKAHREFMQDHAAEVLRYAEVSTAVDQLRALQAEAIVVEPPAYYPPRPAPWDGLGTWRHQVERVEAYRARWGVIDEERLLGARPTDPEQRAGYEEEMAVIGTSAVWAAKQREGERRAREAQEQERWGPARSASLER